MHSQEIQSKNLIPLAKINFFLLGLATLIGWNAVLSSIDFYSSKFPDYNISFIMVIPSFIATFIFSLFASYFSKIFSLNSRIFGSILVMSISLILLPLEAYYLPTESGFVIFFILNFIISAFIAIMQATCVGLACIFPYEAMSLFNTGIGFSGILMSLLRIICILAFNNSSDPIIMMDSILIYYCSAVFFLLLTLCIHIIFVNSNYFKILSKVLTRVSVAIKGDDINYENNGSINEKYADLRKDEENEIERQLLVNPELETKKIGNQNNFLQTLLISFKEAFPFSIFIALLYLQTFALFPGVTLKKQIYELDLTWNPVILVLIYNLFDTFGKYIAVARIFFTKNKITSLILIRFIFFGSFLLNIQTNYDMSFLTSQWFCIVNLAFFALSNGYLTTAIFILASESCVKAQQKEKIGFMMSFMFNIGCIGGSLLALGFAGIN